jgi:hypothetical protein
MYVPYSVHTLRTAYFFWCSDLDPVRSVGTVPVQYRTDRTDLSGAVGAY